MLIIEPALHEGGIEFQMPTEIANLQTAHIFLQEISPEVLNFVAADSLDPVWETTADKAFFLINGCDSKFTLDITPGVWTRVNVLFQGTDLSIILNFFGNNLDHGCEIGVLAKDGVYLETVPRMLNPGYPGLHFTISSRADVVIKCPAKGGAAYDFDITVVKNTVELTVGKLQVVGNDGNNGALPEWKPCRPYYLMDLFDIPDDMKPVTEQISLREGINGAVFDPFVYIRDDYQEGQVVEWSMTHTDVHPLHIHVYHMQYQQDPANLPETPGYNRKGDWVDTVSVPFGVAVVRTLLDRYGGSVFMHCHVYSHADTGMATWFLVNGGYGPLSTPAILKHGTCPIPHHKPYNDASQILPGLIDPSKFDEGGINVGHYASPEPDLANPPTLLNGATYTPHAMNDARRDAAVAVYMSTDAHGSEYDVARLKDGDWLSYAVNFQEAGDFKIAVRANWDGEAGFSLGFKLNDHDCNSAEGMFGRIEVEGASAGDYESLISKETATFSALGQNNLIMCVLRGTGIRLSLIGILKPGISQSDPYIPQPVPGTLETQYLDTDGGSSITRRTEEVVIDRYSSIKRIDVVVVGQVLGYVPVSGGLPLSFPVNIEESGTYTIGMYIYVNAETAKDSQGILMRVGIDSEDCSAEPAWVLDDAFLGGHGTPTAPALYVAAENIIFSDNHLGVHVLTFCFDRVPDGTIIDGFTLNIGGLPTPGPSSGTPVVVPGVIQAAEHDIVPVRYWGEGICWHNLLYEGWSAEGVVQSHFQTPEISIDVLPDQTIGWLHHILSPEWLSYTVQFTAAGTHHVVLTMAGLPAPFNFAYSMSLDNTNCNDEAAQLFVNQMENFVAGGGLGQFARFPALTSFTVTDEMLNGPHTLTLCFISVPPSAELQIQSLDIVAGPTPGGANVRSCYTDECNPVPTLRMENYDKGGANLAFYNIDDGAFAGVSDTSVLLCFSAEYSILPPTLPQQ